MDTFNQSAWAQENFSQDFLEKADIYIQERRKMIRIISSLHAFYPRLSIRDVKRNEREGQKTLICPKDLRTTRAVASP
jgi:hypothetical protein